MGRQRARDARAELIEQMKTAQQGIRDCAGCGLCCTAARNAVQILPIEGRGIAAWIERQGTAAARDFQQRLLRAIRRFHLGRGAARTYTCPFLTPEFRCALPASVKPVACLSFNPIERERCELEKRWYQRAFAGVKRQNARARLPSVLQPIPVAVLEALKTGSAPRRGGR
ncbi:MAG: hypothetical protein HY812_22210 [Planctomycetes bacterium]|nr:hypothetical protein [Planctomycetota bacterium]